MVSAQINVRIQINNGGELINLYIEVCDEIIHPFTNFNGATVEVLKWMMYFIPHFAVRVITYPCWD